MAKRVALTGNEAVAVAMKQINPDVIAAYPITPQTDIVQYFSSFVSDGQVDTQLVRVESEHSAMSATIGASAAGARAQTATSSQGLALMHEMLHIASSYRLPIVMPVVNRALSGPINIHCDHSDSMNARDTGWIHLYCENTQEAYDNMFIAQRIAEHKDILTPVMVCYDGFIISHALENLMIEDDSVVRGFVGEYKAENHLLDLGRPITFGPLALYDYYFEIKRQQAEVMFHAKGAINDISAEYGKLTGRSYHLFETYMLDDADIAIMVIGSTAGTARGAVDQLRAKGIRAGMIKLRVLRPVPREEIIDAVRSLKVLAVMDRADSFGGFGGPLFSEVRSWLYGSPAAGLPVVNYVYGLGGRDVVVNDVLSVFEYIDQLRHNQAPLHLVQYLGVRE
jgi:pyruvate ferredoxin oxidoreductase alpha subunit